MEENLVATYCHVFDVSVFTLPRVVRDLLMLAPSFNLVPFAPVDSALSDPARSTRDTLLTLRVED